MDEQRENFSKTKSIIIGAVVLIVVVASFWLSFSLGKKVFVPVRPETPAEVVNLGITTIVPESSLAAPLSRGGEKAPAIEMPKIEVKVTPVVPAPAVSQVEKTAPEKTQKPAPARPRKKAVARPAKVETTKKEPQAPSEKLLAEAKTEKKAEPLKEHFYYKVLAGSFTKENNAKYYAELLKTKGFPVFIDKVTVVSQKFYRLQTGAFAKRNEAESMVARLKEQGFEGAILIE